MSVPGSFNCIGAQRSARRGARPRRGLSLGAFRGCQGLQKLRELLERLQAREGVQLSRRVGLTSHIADVIRKAGIPAAWERLDREAAV